MDKDLTYEITCEFFDSFQVKIRKGKVVWCSDQSHPIGTDWKSLRESYENKINYKCYVTEIKEED